MGWRQYSDKVIEYFTNPRNAGTLDNPDGHGFVGDPSWGIEMELYIRVEENIITEARFQTFGCGAAIATTSMITEMIKGKSIGEVLRISDDAVAAALDGLPPPKRHCASLGRELIESAVDDYHARKKKGNDSA